MLKAYIAYFRYKNPGDKKPGPVRQFRLYANSLEEARKLVAQQATYPDLQVMDIKAA